MSARGSLKLSINLNRGISSTSECNRIISDEKEDEFLREESSDTNKSSMGMSGLLNVRIPTGTKAQKRKHIQTNFDNMLVNESSLDAQRKEKARLERLERQKKAFGETDHIQQVAAMLPKSVAPLPVLDVFEPEVICLIGDSPHQQVDSKKNCSFSDGTCKSTASVSKVEPEIIELSSGDEDEKNDCHDHTQQILPYRVVPPLPYNKRSRWLFSGRKKIDQENMEKQHQMERQRMKKIRNSHDLEKIELTTTGRLLVNAGHGPEDPDVHVCPHLTHILQPHQLGGVRFMYDNIIESLSEFDTSPGFGCILAHSMGLGKTIQVITFIEVFLRVTRAKKVLIIVPINTIQNWMNEFEKWTPRLLKTGEYGRHFEVFLLGDSVKTFDRRLNLIEEWSRRGGVLLIGYEMFRLLIRTTQPKKSRKPKPKNTHSEPAENNGKLDESNKELTMNDQIKEESIDIIRGALVDPGPDMVVCDEGHKIKNLNTDIAAALSAIQTRRRIVLTGYPLQNNLMEYYCMVDFVRPDFLGSRKNFSIQFERPIRNGQCIDSTARDIKIARQRIHVLNNMLRGFIQRRTHHLLKAILPEAKEFVLLLRKSPLQHALYRNFVMYANAEISSGNTSVFNPLKAFAACSKIWNHPDILAHTLERKREDKKKWAKKDSLSTCTSPALKDLHPSTNLELITIPGSMPPCISNPKAECNLIATDVNRIWSPGRPDFRIPSSIHEETKDFATASEAARITHHDLWRGVFDDYSTLSFEANNAVISNKDDFNRNSAKSKHSRSRNIQGVLEDEVDITDNDQDLQYDWAETTMASYKTGNIEHGYKMVMAMELLDATVRIGEKMLIFSQNLTALDLIESYLCNRPLKTITGASSWMKNVNFFRLDGSTPAPERERLINRFNSDPGVHLFLISTKAGSLGINLVAANRCIIFDACWNPCHDAQAVCRVYRYGQQRRTYVYRLILNNCMEKAIFNRQISKHGLQQRIVDDAQVDANITQKELETLLMYDESLDVTSGKWDTSDWNFDDEVLESVVKRRSEILAEEPFLHESLILEREEGLSEEEKKEAELWFAKEQIKDVSENKGTQSFETNTGEYIGRYSRIPAIQLPHTSSPFVSSMIDAAPLRSTPVPYMIDRIPESLPSSSYGSSFRVSNMKDSGGMRNVIDRGLCNENFRVPSFPGAVVAFEPSSNSRGSVQLITTDRSLCLPIVSHPTETRDIPANTEALLVRSADGVFLRLRNGLLLNAQGSIFDSHPTKAYPSINIQPKLPQPLNLPPSLKTYPDIIELD